MLFRKSTALISHQVASETPPVSWKIGYAMHELPRMKKEDFAHRHRSRHGNLTKVKLVLARTPSTDGWTIFRRKQKHRDGGLPAGFSVKRDRGEIGLAPGLRRWKEVDSSRWHVIRALRP